MFRPVLAIIMLSRELKFPRQHDDGQYRPKHVVVSITVIKYTSVIKLCLTTYLFLVLVKRSLFLLNAALAIATLHLISQVHLPPFVKMLPKYLKDSTFSSCFWSYWGRKFRILFVICIDTEP